MCKLNRTWNYRRKPRHVMLRPIMKMTLVLDLWWVRLTALIRRVRLKTLKNCLNVKLALCQTHCRQVPVFSRLSGNHLITWSLHTYHTSSSYLRVNMGCALVTLFQVRSLYVPTKDRSPLQGRFWESLVFRLHSEIDQINLSIEAQWDHHMLSGFGQVLGLKVVAWEQLLVVSLRVLEIRN